MSPAPEPQEDLRLTLEKRFKILSKSEREILSSLVEGKLNKQIAADRGKNIRTVELHVQNILRKLGAGTRTQAGILAIVVGGYTPVLENLVQKR